MIQKKSRRNLHAAGTAIDARNVHAIYYCPGNHVLSDDSQSKRLKAHEGFLKDLKRGDEVITSSGILGKVDGMTEQFVTLEIADGVKVRMLKKQIAGTAASATTAATSETKKA